MYKPVRTHHCSACKKCIPRMDHHCPFIQNCVGFRNHRFFFGLLAFGSISSGFGFSQNVAYGVYCFPSQVDNLQLMPKIGLCFIGLVFVMTQLALCLSCLALLYEHVEFVLSNTTKIEVMSLRDSNAPVFSLGVLFNLKQFFRNFYIAFLPIAHAEKYEGVLYSQPGQDLEYCEVTLKVGEEFDQEQAKVIATARNGDLSKIIEALPDLNKDHREVVYIFNVMQFSEKNL